MAKEDKLIQDLANKYHVSVDKVRKAVSSQFAFTAEKMAEPDFPSIRLPYFGKFFAKQSRINHLKNSKKKKNERS
jgi:nucleoid DNA-binding protein